MSFFLRFYTSKQLKKKIELENAEIRSLLEIIRDPEALEAAKEELVHSIKLGREKIGLIGRELEWRNQNPGIKKQLLGKRKFRKF